MINLGLQRIRQLAHVLGDPQSHLKVFHVAGTNGKGSVCTYIESMLSCAGYTTGKYTSPHLVDPSDSVHINQRPMRPDEYERSYASVARLAREIGASPFEIGTAVAFDQFAKHKVDYSVVEVGLGGLEDATNILDASNVECSVITKIAVDHEAFLGSTLRSVAQHKAGIIKPGVPCVVDGSNHNEVLDVVRTTAERIGTELTVTTPTSTPILQNQSVARAVMSNFGLSPELCDLGIKQAVWPGRMQWVDEHTLVDGAHNVSAATELRKYVSTLNKPVRWVLAFSKPCDEIVPLLVQSTDTVCATQFGTVKYMPWVHSLAASTVAEVANKYSTNVHVTDNVASLPPFEGVTVVCGSLYLVGEFLRHL